MYLGHHPDGSGVQLHSAGGLYPYVIALRERYNSETDSFVRTYEVTGPAAEYECPTWDEAVAFAEARRDEWKERNKPVKVERPAPRQPGGIGIEASVKGQHAVGVHQTTFNGITYETYYIVGPRATDEVFYTHRAATRAIDYLESDFHTIELQFTWARQRAWSQWAADRNKAH